MTYDKGLFTVEGTSEGVSWCGGGCVIVCVVCGVWGTGRQGMRCVWGTERQVMHGVWGTGRQDMCPLVDVC